MEFRRARLSEDLPAIRSLLAAAEESDGRPALSEHKYVRLAMGSPVRRTVGEDESGLVAYAQADHHPGSAVDPRGHWAVEVVIHPAHRTMTMAIEVIQAGLRIPPAADPASVWAWHSEQIAAAEALNLREVRRIIQLQRPLPSEPQAAPGVLMRTFRSGDENELIRINNSAFAGHRENAAMDRADLELRMSQTWFDAEGLLLAEEEGEVVGFCWTKSHPDSVGEIYIIAVAPDAQNRGLGRALTRAALHHLGHDRHARQAMLWVDGHNAAGLHLYRSMGFREVFVSREYEA